MITYALKSLIHNRYPCLDWIQVEIRSRMGRQATRSDHDNNESTEQ
jgi:hypothetical protein